MESESMNILTVRSKRRRRRRRHQSDKEIPEPLQVAARPCINMKERVFSPLENASSNATDVSSLVKSVVQPAIARLRHTTTEPIRIFNVSIVLLLLLLLSNGSALGVSSPCDKDSWWDSFKDRCITCTVCQGDMIPLRPCQIHRDTICGSIYDLKIDWVVLAKTEPNWKLDRRKSDGAAYGLSALEQQLSNEELQQLHENAIPLDWQTAALFMAVLACLLFFIVAACILIHHMRQWRRMERRLDQDVEELSTKLMAKLAEVQSFEGGTLFIGNADALQVPATFQPQHVLLPAEKPSKHHSHQQHLHHHHHQHERRFLKTIQPGNVYIENGSKA